jgi:hypothetical protein
MTAPGCLYALLIVLACAVGGIIATAFAWTALAVVLGVVAVFFTTLALTYVIPAATKETR